MKNTKTPMKDKETKEMFDDLLMEVMGSYHDFMMNKISLNKHKAVEQKVGDFIKGVEQEAERRGYQNCLDDIWEEARGLRSFAEHDGSVSSADVEAGLQEAYLNIESKLKDNK